MNKSLWTLRPCLHHLRWCPCKWPLCRTQSRSSCGGHFSQRDWRRGLLRSFFNRDRGGDWTCLDWESWSPQWRTWHEKCSMIVFSVHQLWSSYITQRCLLSLLGHFFVAATSILPGVVENLWRPVLHVVSTKRKPTPLVWCYMEYHSGRVLFVQVIQRKGISYAIQFQSPS